VIFADAFGCAIAMKGGRVVALVIVVFAISNEVILYSRAFCIHSHNPILS